MPAPDSVRQLIDTFENNLSFYKSGRYNEFQLRQEFLDPLFKALGWDMDNEAGLAPQYRDVIHEASIKIGGVTKAPDYAFSIHGQYKFFLEAKKPAVNVHSDTEPAYQLRRYGWSAKLPVSILTDFEEFAIYDCRKRPKRGERASSSRLGYFKYTDYIEKWDELCRTFSKEAILKGSFDKYTVDSKRHRGSDTVDNAFLEEIENWRSLLARNFALRNLELSVRDLNFAVQKTIDRLIFLRICEDRGTEDYKRLATLINGARVYPRLLELFRQADARYNSGLFHFSKESGRGAPDAITPELALDDKVLKGIISKLYYPESPYEFSVLPADILGQVYEQFLGSTIHLTAGHHAKVDKKPEVRKAGGVYYTPGYIVDYIVRNTLGCLLDGDDPDKPKPIPVSKVAEIKVLDPACGSGSFLIVAYQYLLDWHLCQYTADPETNELDEGKIKRHSGGKKPKLYQSPDGAWKLTTDERKRILINNIFGVDIDAQAVEVTKLSLLLKVIEGETHQITQRDWFHERQRILPDLGNNIKCGNSLIGPDFYDNEQMLLLDEEIQYRINVFDWNQGFSDVMRRGGFDCVIGNPPYGASLDETQKAFFSSRFTCQSYQLDSYLLFLERMLSSILIEGGKLGFIIPNPWLTNIKQQATRRFISETAKVEQVVHFMNPVFPAAIVDTQIVILSVPVSRSNLIDIYLSSNCTLENKMNIVSSHTQNQDGWKKRANSVINIFLSEDELDLFSKIQNHKNPLGDVVNLAVGIKPYQKGKGTPKQTSEDVKGRIYDSAKKHDALYRQIIRGKDIARYSVAPTETRYIKYGIWLAEPRPKARFESPLKIVMRQTGDSLVAAYDTNRFLCMNNMHVLTPSEDMQGLSMLYILGLINSGMLNWYYQCLNPEKGEILAEVKRTNVARLSVRPIDFDNADDVAKHDRMVSLVEQMLELTKKKADDKNPGILQQIETQITATDRQIDRLVYDLYDLTSEEIELVEQGPS